MRTRFFFDENKNHLLLTNFKVGYTALNAQLPAHVKRLKNVPNELTDTVAGLPKDRVSFVVRDPVERWMSFYFHWFVKRPYIGQPPAPNKQFELLERFADKNFYDAFVSMSSDERKNEEVMRRYCLYFPLVYSLDGHTRYQLSIIKSLGLEEDDVTEIVPLDDLSDFISREYDMPFEKRLPSGRPNTAPDFVEQMCKVLYAVDYEFLHRKTPISAHA